MLNLEVIEELKALPADNGGDLFTQFAKMFLLAYPEHLKQIETYLNRSDCISLEREAHTLKSVCANLGAMSLADLARNIEHIARMRDLSGVSSLVSEMKANQPLVHKALGRLLPELD